MGKILKALSPQSSYAARKTDLWDELMEQLEDTMFEEDLDEFVVHLDTITLRIPVAWRGPLDERVEKRREEIRAEDPLKIMRDRFDF